MGECSDVDSDARRVLSLLKKIWKRRTRGRPSSTHSGRPLAKLQQHAAIVRFVHTSCAATIPGIDGACIAIVMQMLPVTLEQLIVARAAAEPRRHFSSTRLLGISAQVGGCLKYHFRITSGLFRGP